MKITLEPTGEKLKAGEDVVTVWRGETDAVLPCTAFLFGLLIAPLADETLPARSAAHV